MGFIHGMYGPDLNRADLISFDFGDASLLMRLPEHSEKSGRKLLAPNDLTCIPDGEWDVDTNGTKTYYTIAKQCWLYKYFHKQLNVERDIFETKLILVLKALSLEETSDSRPLDNAKIAKIALGIMYRNMEDVNRQLSKDMSQKQAIREWQLPVKASDVEVIKHEPLNWVVIPFGNVGNGAPIPHIFVPINRQYFLIIIIESSKLAYSNINDAFTNDDVELVKRQIIEEFLKHVRVEYSPEILEEIGQLN